MLALRWGEPGARGGGDRELRESTGNFPDSGEGLGRLSLLGGPRQKLLKEGLPGPLDGSPPRCTGHPDPTVAAPRALQAGHKVTRRGCTA